MDVAVTLLDLAGIDIANHATAQDMRGQSLLPYRRRRLEDRLDLDALGRSRLAVHSRLVVVHEPGVSVHEPGVSVQLYGLTVSPGRHIQWDIMVTGSTNVAASIRVIS